MSFSATNDRRRPKGVRRGVSLLPAACTIFNLFFGFWAMILTLRGFYAAAALRIGIAIVLDVFDGKIARMTGTVSEFGGELDSLADVISFGVAPALLLYRWAFEAIIPGEGLSALLHRAGWLVAFLFVTCGTLRLARFNVQRNVVDSRYFIGLPIPAAAGQAAAVVYSAPQAISDGSLAALVLLATMTLGFLMVSGIRYRSFKSFDLHSRRSYLWVLALAAAIALIFLHPRGVLLLLATLYTLSGPLMQTVSYLRRRGEPPPVAVPQVTP